MILVTGAAGKTGVALMGELKRRGRSVRALVRRESQITSALQAGAAQACAGDLLDPASLEPAFQGASSIYHIPPNIHPREVEIGEIVLQLARQYGLDHFVYHSVLHPYVRAMPHHLKKAEVEELIFASGLSFTILQPEAYMQNFLPGLASAKEQGIFPVPYPVGSKLGMVDLADVVQVGALVLEDPAHHWATYELSAGETWTPARVAEAIGAALEKHVQAVEIEQDEWKHGATRAGMSRYQIETLSKMFAYYAEHGFWGNSRVLAGLLGRRPRSFLEFLSETLQTHAGA